MINLQSPWFFLRVIAFAFTTAVGTLANADDSVSLEIVRGNGNDLLSSASRAELDAMAQRTVNTTSPYFDGRVRFSGPLLEDVLKQKVGGDIGTNTPITLTALNDYSVGTTFGVLSEAEAIIATRKDGVRLLIRDRGPFWLMLPLSDRPEMDNENYQRLLVWHLSQIAIDN